MSSVLMTSSLKQKTKKQDGKRYNPQVDASKQGY